MYFVDIASASEKYLRSVRAIYILGMDSDPDIDVDVCEFWTPLLARYLGLEYPVSNL